MEQHKFDRATAEAMMAMLAFPEAGLVQDDGVFVADDFRNCSPPEQAFDWTPAYDMDWPGAPNPITAPALPIPFTAGELAAFMLDGMGAGLQDYLDRRIGCPLDDEALKRFGKRGRLVRKALRDAYDLARKAQDTVGAIDHEEQQRAHDLFAASTEAYDQALKRENVMERVIVGTKKNGDPEYGPYIQRDEYLLRLARAKETVAAQQSEALEAKATADAKFIAWRRGMVHCLLMPQGKFLDSVVTESASKELSDATADAGRAFGCPTTEMKSKPHSRKMAKTKVFEAEVMRLMTKFWDERNRGTKPTKGDLCKLVFAEILRGTVRGERVTTLGMVTDAAKPWKFPTVLPDYVPQQVFKEKRHTWKGDK